MAITDLLCLQIKAVLIITCSHMTETYISSCNPLSTRLLQYGLQAGKVELLPFHGSWGKCYVRFPF